MLTPHTHTLVIAQHPVATVRHRIFELTFIPLILKQVLVVANLSI